MPYEIQWKVNSAMVKRLRHYQYLYFLRKYALMYAGIITLMVILLGPTEKWYYGIGAFLLLYICFSHRWLKSTYVGKDFNVDYKGRFDEDGLKVTCAYSQRVFKYDRIDRIIENKGYVFIVTKEEGMIIPRDAFIKDTYLSEWMEAVEKLKKGKQLEVES